MGATGIKIRSGAGPCAGYRQGSGARALHADELGGKPRNRLTSSHTDPVTNTPAYKETSVHMNVLAEVGESPLPRINSRFGHPTPQNGARSRRKRWKRTGLHTSRKRSGAVADRQVTQGELNGASTDSSGNSARNPRAELQSRLEQAPLEHAEAVLAAYEVLQELHNRGVLEIMRGALAASDEILEKVVDDAKSPGSHSGDQESAFRRHILEVSNRNGSRASFSQFLKGSPRQQRSESSQLDSLACFGDS